MWYQVDRQNTQIKKGLWVKKKELLNALRAIALLTTFLQSVALSEPSPRYFLWLLEFMMNF